MYDTQRNKIMSVNKVRMLLAWHLNCNFQYVIPYGRFSVLKTLFIYTEMFDLDAIEVPLKLKVA